MLLEQQVGFSIYLNWMELKVTEYKHIEGREIKISYLYDQDPRYGWFDVQLPETKNNFEIVVHGFENGSLGFTFDGENFVPTCICSAWNVSECSCPNVSWGDENE